MWQQQLVREISDRLPAGAALEVVGSSRDEPMVDGWSDLDLHLRLPQDFKLVQLLSSSHKPVRMGLASPVGSDSP